MAAFLHNLLTASLYGSVIIAIILLLRLLLRKAPKNVICLLWLLAAVRLLVPFHMESTWSLQPDFVQDVPTQLEQTFTPPVENPVIPEPAPGPTEPVQSPSSPAVTTPVDPPVTETRAVDPIAIAGWIWAAGAVGLAAYGTASYLLLRRRVADAVILSEGVWMTRLNTAMVLGFFRPKVYLCAGLDETQREFVLRHEKCHIRRGDHWWKPLGFLTLAVHWFNPVVWLGYWLLCRDLEMACDEAVIRDLDLSQRKSYSAALLSCSAHRHTIAACPVAFGEVSVKERIKNVLNYKKPAFWIILVAVIAILVVAVCFLTSPGRQAEETAPDDWGITMSVETATDTSVTILVTQTGALPLDQYLYGKAFHLEVWSGTTWEPVPLLTEAVFTTEAMALNNNGQTSIFIDWAWLYGQLPNGYYRISKAVTEFATKETRTYDACFQLNLNEDTVALPDSELSANDQKTLQMLQLAMEKLRQQEAYHIVYETTQEGYPSQTGSSTEFFGSIDRWVYHQRVHMRYTSENWAAGNMLLDGIQYRYGHAKHYTSDRNWTVSTKNQQTDLHWLLRAHILQENVTLVMTSYTADTIEITLYFDGPPRDTLENTCYGYVQTWHLDLDWNLLGVTEGYTLPYSEDGVDYYVRTTIEIQILDTAPAQIAAWLDAVEAEVRADNPTESTPPSNSTSGSQPENYWPDTPENPSEDLLALTELFGAWGTLYNSALTSTYESPAFINLCFFLEGVSKQHAAQLTEEEQAAFADYGIENMEVFRYTREEVDGYLQQYFGITSADLDEIAVRNLNYLESTDCFYIFTNGWDGHVRGVNVIFVEPQADGTVLMYYTTDGWPAEKLIARIQPTDSGYIILSNLKP